MTGMLPVPPLATEEVTMSLFEFNGRRKLYRTNHAVTFVAMTNITALVSVAVQSRILLRYA